MPQRDNGRSLKASLAGGKADIFGLAGKARSIFQIMHLLTIERKPCLNTTCNIFLTFYLLPLHGCHDIIFPGNI